MTKLQLNPRAIVCLYFNDQVQLAKGPGSGRQLTQLPDWFLLSNKLPGRTDGGGGIIKLFLVDRKPA